ncbi:hypothetical protein BDN72DRAFT_772416 [Pluteus cervinus]|uniref:Uncharacterized protein n=1 Tax=Pluteus cervinus TaxID=181527 RepID=A0ACD3AKC2_9AGAR|nr:hypothetical protein BDN72DRAFT_772416 [Pluteus cervinus]
MNLLHELLERRDKQAFRRLLESSSNDQGSTSGASGLSTSGGKSWNRPSKVKAAMALVNTKDKLGRTVLHLACISVDSLDFVKVLLSHPAIDVNVLDDESHWTALHRALYHGNIPAATLLLQRSETDISVRDLDGYTPFDLYNATINGAHPAYVEDLSPICAELFTWGTNKNATLGLGDGGDRAYPDHVVMLQKKEAEELRKKPLDERFAPIYARQLQMSKLHTAVVTSEHKGNVRLCGFGNGGRLGQTQHTQYTLEPVSQFQYKIDSIALGQDHTLALTSSGEVLSWGLNRYSQLGYVVDPPLNPIKNAHSDEPIQSVPRKISSLKKHQVIGITASKAASACWTSTEVYAWGANNGQFGFDQPVQPFPRIVTHLSMPVLSVCLSDSAMVCLLASREVVCLWNNRHFKLRYTRRSYAYHIPWNPDSYSPPHMHGICRISINKVTNCDDMFAVLSTSGDLFTFSAPSSAEGVNKDKFRLDPQRVTALKKQFSPIRDVALGQDGTIIFCTKSGHVFVQSRKVKSGQAGSGKSSNFQRVPFLQRVTQVSANSSGAYGALREEHISRPITVTGNSVAQDLATLEPYFDLYKSPVKDVSEGARPGYKKVEISKTPPLPVDGDADDPIIQADIIELAKLCQVLVVEKAGRRSGTSPLTDPQLKFPHGADLLVYAAQSGSVLPAHRLILAAQCGVLSSLLSGSTSAVKDSQSNLSIRLAPRLPSDPVLVKARLSVHGCHALSILLLVHYLYSDNLIAIWDRRVAVGAARELASVKAKPDQISSEVMALARALGLSSLTEVLEAPTKRASPPIAEKNLTSLFNLHQTCTLQDRQLLLAPDVILELADKNVYCHSTILRARSELFGAFFDDEVWTTKRWDERGIGVVKLKHMKSHVVEFALKFMCCGAEGELFEVLEFANTVEDVLDFMFQVVAVANELLLDRLLLICSGVILKLLSIQNACYILSEATYFHLLDLVDRVQEFIAVNMEVFLESRMLEGLPLFLIKELATFISRRQIDAFPVVRSNLLVKELMAANRDWLAIREKELKMEKDRKLEEERRKEPGKPLQSGDGVEYFTSVSPGNTTPRRKSRSGASGSPPKISLLQKQLKAEQHGDVFTLDEGDAVDNGQRAPVNTSPTARRWNVPAVAPPANLKSIMQEETATPPRSPRIGSASTLPPFTAIPPKRVPSSSSLSSWRIPAKVGTPGGNSPVGTPLVPAIISASPSRTSAAAGRTGSGSQPPMTPPRPQTQKHTTQPGLGPVFTPMKLLPESKKPSGLSVSRNTPGKAWTLSPVQPIVEPSSTSFAGPSSSPTTGRAPSGISLVAIQQLELDLLVKQPKEKASLLNIQAEEKAKQEEVDFLKWWKEEEERVKQEEITLRASLEASQQQPGGSGGGRGRARGGGRGRGRGRVPSGGHGGRSEGGNTQENHPTSEDGATRPRKRGGRGRSGPKSDQQSLAV